MEQKYGTILHTAHNYAKRYLLQINEAENS